MLPWKDTSREQEQIRFILRWKGGRRHFHRGCVVNSVLVARQGISEWSASSCGDWGDWEIEVEHRTLIPTPRLSQ